MGAPAACPGGLHPPSVESTSAVASPPVDEPLCEQVTCVEPSGRIPESGLVKRNAAPVPGPSTVTARVPHRGHPPRHRPGTSPALDVSVWVSNTAPALPPAANTRPSGWKRGKQVVLCGSVAVAAGVTDGPRLRPCPTRQGRQRGACRCVDHRLAGHIDDLVRLPKGRQARATARRPPTGTCRSSPALAVPRGAALAWRVSSAKARIRPPRRCWPATRGRFPRPRCTGLPSGRPR